MKKKNALIALCATVVLGFLLFVSSRGEQPAPIASDDPLKVGVILPLSGDLAALGEEVQKGIAVAVAEAAVDGKKIEIIYEDDGFDPKRSVSAANKLLSVDKADVVLTMLVEEAQPIMPLFESAQVPLLVLWDSNALIAEGGTYSFSNGFSTEHAAKDIATYAYTVLGLRTIAVIGHVNPWAEISIAAFKNRFEALGGSVLFTEVFQTDTTDYRAVIAKAKSAQADGVYFPLIPPGNARFLIQAKELGLASTLLTGDPLIADAIAEAGAAAEGVYYTNIHTDAAQELTGRYRTAFGTDPFDLTLVSFGYDGVMKILEADRVDGSLQSGLENVFGPGRTADRRERIYRVEQGVPKQKE